MKPAKIAAATIAAALAAGTIVYATLCRALARAWDQW